jgi:hypothetical protein
VVGTIDQNLTGKIWQPSYIDTLLVQYTPHLPTNLNHEPIQNSNDSIPVRSQYQRVNKHRCSTVSHAGTSHITVSIPQSWFLDRVTRILSLTRPAWDPDDYFALILDYCRVCSRSTRCLQIILLKPPDVSVSTNLSRGFARNGCKWST